MAAATGVFSWIDFFLDNDAREGSDLNGSLKPTRSCALYDRLKTQAHSVTVAAEASLMSEMAFHLSGMIRRQSRD